MFAGNPRPSLGDEGNADAPSEEDVLSSRRSAREEQRTARVQEFLSNNQRIGAQEGAVTPSASQINMLISSLNNVW